MAFADRNSEKFNQTDQKNLDKLINIDAEIAIIGCLLWDNRSYEKVADFLENITNFYL